MDQTQLICMLPAQCHPHITGPKFHVLDILFSFKDQIKPAESGLTLRNEEKEWKTRGIRVQVRRITGVDPELTFRVIWTPCYFLWELVDPLLVSIMIWPWINKRKENKMLMENILYLIFFLFYNRLYLATHKQSSVFRYLINYCSSLW